MSALVLDAHLKSSLSAIRSLGRAKIDVVAGAVRGSAMGLHSRYVTERFMYPDPKRNQADFVEAVRVQAMAHFDLRGTKLVVFCFSDETHLSLARSFNQLKDVLLFPLPPHEPREVTFDKEKMQSFALMHHVPVITTYRAEEFDTITYPAVVKPRHSVTWKDGEAVSGTAKVVFSAAELMERVGRVRTETGESPIVQEFISGEEFGFECLCRSGKVIQWFSHQRVRSLSPLGGAAVVKQTLTDVEFVKTLRQYAERLLAELQWTGPAMVEFKIDGRDDSVKLMEINGRFWGSLPLAVAAGVDFPLGYYELATEGGVKSPQDFSPRPVRTRHFAGDCKWLLGVMLDETPLRATHYPTRLKAFTDFTLEMYRSRSDVFSWSDPKPSLWEFIDILRR